MKIVHITRKLLEEFAYQDKELAEMHAKLGHSVTIITSASDDKSLSFDRSQISQYINKKEIIELYSIIRLPLKYKVNYRFWMFKHLYETLTDLAPDIIFFHGIPPFCLFDICRYQKEFPTVKVVMDCHSDFNNSGSNWLSRNVLHKIIYRWVIKKTMKSIIWYYYITPNTKEFMQAMYKIPESKLRFLPLGGNIDQMNIQSSSIIRENIRVKLGIPQNAIVVVNGGKLDAKKMTHSLVGAITALNHPDVHLIIFGVIDRSYEKQLCEAINNNQKIHLIGWVESKDVYDYFLASDIACFPGGQSVMWIQAICCGLPLIVRNWNNSIGYLNVKDNVILLDDNDSQSIQNAISLLTRDSDLRKQMHENAELVGRSFFSYRRIAQSVIDDLN